MPFRRHESDGVHSVYSTQQRTFTDDNNDDASEDSEPNRLTHPRAALEYIHVFPSLGIQNHILLTYL